MTPSGPLEVLWSAQNQFTKPMSAWSHTHTHTQAQAQAHNLTLSHRNNYMQIYKYIFITANQNPECLFSLIMHMSRNMIRCAVGMPQN